MSGSVDRTPTDGGVQLAAGERILRRAISSDRLIMKRFYIATGLIAAAILSLQLMGEGVGWWPALSFIAVLAAVMLLYSHFFERGARWILTNQRLIGPREGSIPLSPNLKVREFLWGIGVRQSIFKTVNIRSIEDKSSFAAAIRSAILSKATGEDFK